MPLITRIIQNVFLAPDPGLERLGSASRSLIVTLGAATALFGIYKNTDMPLTAFLLGIILALQVNMFIRDETRRERLGTAMYALAVSVVAITAVAALGSVPLLKQWMLLPVVFGVFYVQRYGQRAKTVGWMFGWMYLFGAYYNVTLPQLPWYWLAFLVSFGTFFLIRFFVWRDDRRRGWRYYYQALFVHIARLMVDACKGKPGKRRDLQLCSIAVEDRLYRFGHHEAVSTIQNLRVETERLTASLTKSGGGDLTCEEVRGLSDNIRRYPFRGLGLGDEPPKAYVRLELALLAAVESAPAKARRRTRHSTPKLSEYNVKLLQKGRVDPHTRKAIQATLAVGITLFITLSISTTHWLWGILAALFVFMGTESTGHVFDKGLQRVSGTIFGVVGGLVLARLLAGTPALEAVAVLTGVFFLVYFHTVNYTLSTFAAIISIGLIYNISDLPHLELMELRLAETAIGASAGFFTARLVLGTHTRNLVRAGSADLLRAIRNAVKRENGDAVLAVFEVDRQLRNLVNQVNPLLRSVNFIHRKRVARRMTLFDLAVHFTKRSLRTARTSSATAAGLCAVIDRHLEILLEMFEDRHDSPYITEPPGFPIETGEERALAYLEKSLRDLIDEFRR